MKNPFKSQNSKDDDVKKTKKTADSDKKEEKGKRKYEKFTSFEIEPEDWDQPAIPKIADTSEKKVSSEKPAEKLTEKPAEKTAVVVDKKGETKKEKPIYVYKPSVDQKLSIILIENTAEVAKENDKLIKIIKKLVPTGLISIIHYGKDIRKSEISEMFKLKDTDFQCSENVGEEACLSDALVILHKLVTEEYMVVKEEKFRRTKVNEIEIIGIGTCKDNCSKNPKSVGINCFCDIAKKPKIVTKYFCLTEDSFLEAAEIGFHSIGAINTNYK